eukprot:m51a1_g5776 hypothetical protein (145) ;mRNA; f:1252824-1253258
MPFMKAVVFGAPACISENLLEASRSCVTHFVNENDVVPRITGNSIINALGRLGTITGLSRIAARALPSTGKRMVPPGRILHLVSLGEDGVAVVEDQPEDLSSLNLSTWSIEHHRKRSYKAAVRLLIESAHFREAQCGNCVVPFD